MSLSSVDAAAPRFDETVLCTTVLGGAEIFTLERMCLAAPAGLLHCNEALAAQIRRDPAYDAIPLRVHPCLDALSEKIDFRNIETGVNGLQDVLMRGGILLGNLRAASLTLNRSVARRNDAFVHDNSHYLNVKARALIAGIVAASRRTFFPCEHSTLRVPFRKRLSHRMQVEYFADYVPLPQLEEEPPRRLNVAMIGRIEPAKNQKLGVAIADELARHFDAVHLTLLGARSDEAYCAAVLDHGSYHAALSVSQEQLPRSSVPDFLSGQHLVLHTSVAESLPLVLFEANRRGIPFFALPVGGIPEVLPRQYWLNHDTRRSVETLMKALGRPNT